MTYSRNSRAASRKCCRPRPEQKNQDEMIRRSPRAGGRGSQSPVSVAYLQCLRHCIWSAPSLHRASGTFRTALYKIPVDYCKGAASALRCPTDPLSVPELDFDTAVVRMDTAFCPSRPDLHGRQAEELRKPGRPGCQEYLAYGAWTNFSQTPRRLECASELWQLLRSKKKKLSESMAASHRRPGG